MLPLMVLLALEPREALDAGDAAWRAGDRQMARADWKLAAQAEDPALAAMAEARLLRVSGNLGWMVHGPRADRALAACAGADPWCDLAEVDLALTLRDLGLAPLGERPEQLTRRAATTLPEPAAERQRWAEDAASAWPPGPGTWTLGVGVLGGPGLGVGGALRFINPDVRFKAVRLDASALLTSRGVAGLGAGLLTPGRIHGRFGLELRRGVVDLYDGDSARSLVVTSAEGWAALGLRGERSALWLGPQGRVDAFEGRMLAGHGAVAGGRLDGPSDHLSLRGSGELALADYALGRGSLDLRARLPLGRTTLASRLLGDGAPWTDADTPLWRLPSVGGSELLRGAPAGRYRGPWLLDGALELREPLGSSLEIAAFTELAWLPGSAEPSPHPGGGLGLRLSLPPRPDNTVRLDLGFTDAGWGLVAGWGEAF